MRPPAGQGRRAATDRQRLLATSLAPLADRNFALYWIGHLVSNTGRWIELTGAVWLMYELTASPVLLGLLGLARALPGVLLSPAAGVLADRLDQRRLLFVTQGLALLASLAIAVLVWAGRVEAWHLYVEVAVQAAITSFDASGRQALFPRLVPRRDLAQAVTLSATAGRLSELVGPAAGGVAIAALGVTAPFALNAVSFLALMGAVLLISNLEPVARKASSFRGELREGLDHIRSAPVLSGLLKLELAFGLFQLNPVIITIVARETLGAGPAVLGTMLSAPALGGLLGTGILLSIGQPRRQGHFVIVCIAVYAVVLGILAAEPAYLVWLIGLGTLGLLDAFATITRHSTLQLSAPPYLRGRVMGNMRTLTAATGPLSQTQSGILAGWLGPAGALVISSIAVAVAALGTWRTNPSLWRFSRDQPPVDHEDIH